MANPTTTVPKLDLAPKLNRPLQLWNPLDYLRLLYWVFFFPQAVQWYVEKYIDKEPQTERLSRVRILNNFWRLGVNRGNLILQAGIIALSLSWITIYIQPWDIKIAILSLVEGLIVSLLMSSILSDESGLATAIVGGIYCSLTNGLIFGVIIKQYIFINAWLSSQETGILVVVLPYIILFIFIVLGFLGAAFISILLTYISVSGVLSGVAINLPILIIEAVIMSLAIMMLDVSIGAWILLLATRLLDCIYIFLSGLLTLTIGKEHDTLWLLTRVAWVPVPKLEEKIKLWAQVDTQLAFHNSSQLIRYTWQFIPIVNGLNDVFAETPESDLFDRINKLSREPMGWQMLRFCSVSLSEGMSARRTREEKRRDIHHGDLSNLLNYLDQNQHWGLRFKTPIQAACSGYWLFHIGDFKNSAKAFDKIHNLPGGNELYQVVSLLASAQQSKDWKTIAAFADTSHWLASIPESPLRPDSLKTLQRLRSVALDAAVANESISKLNRAAALNRALGELTKLIGDVEQTCPHPEREIVQKIAEQWRDILGRAAAEIGQVVVEKPVDNPYVIGNPVVGKQFVGRDDILRRLEELWSGTGQRSSVVVYGHRRMGKTSILQNLGRYRFGADTRIAELNMQRVGRVENTGELLYDIAMALWRASKGEAFFELSDNSKNASPLPEPSLDEYRQNWYARFNRFLRALDAQRNGSRFILAIDEFELIEDAIADKIVERELLGYLRGIIQTEHWLIIALAGLHTLQEMTSNYFEPLYASVVPVQVSFLSEASLRQIIANPSEDFPLDYDLDALDLIWQLTSGQPYLAQLIGHNLVRDFNAARFERSEKRENKFSVADVESVVNAPEFFDQGGYYFNGLWTQAEQSPAHQTDILRVIAPHRQGLAFADLARETNLDETTIRAALAKLQDHDVVEQVDGVWRVRVELMRRWIESKG